MAELTRKPLKEIVYDNSNTENEAPPVATPTTTTTTTTTTTAMAKAPPRPTIKQVEIVYNDSDDEETTTQPTTAAKSTKLVGPTQPTTKKTKGKKEYEVEVDEETGTMRRTEKTPGVITPAVKKSRAKGRYNKEDILILSYEEPTDSTSEYWTAYHKGKGKMIQIGRNEIPQEYLEALERGEGLVASPEEKMKSFYLNRASDPYRYTYTNEGNLLIKGKDGQPDEVILLRHFTALKPEEIEELETKRKEELVENEESYEDAMMMLREAYTEYINNNRRSADRVFKMNERLREISVARNQRAFPMRWNTELPNPSTNEIDLSQPFEVRKLGYPVYLFKRYPFPFKESMGRYRERGTEGQQEGGSMEVIFINNEESPFHPSYPVEFVHDETKFSSPFQAYQYQRMKQIGGKEDLMKKTLGTQSAQTITNLVVDEKGQPPNKKTLWKDILKSLYSQKKEMQKVLLESGNTTPFFLQDIKRYKDTFEADDYSDALSAVRTELRQEEADGVAPQSYNKGSITTEEQKKARTGAIINNFRKRFS